MTGSYTFADYINNYYMTLLLLASLVMLLFINRRVRMKELRYIRLIIGIVFGMTLCEALQDMSLICRWNSGFLNLGTAAFCCLYPLTVLLEVRMIAPLKRSFLLLIPYLINVLLSLTDLTGTGLIYRYGADRSCEDGPLALLPVITAGFYIAVLGVWSVILISRGQHTKGVIALFMTVTSVITAVGEHIGFARGFTEEVTALGILIYYFFPASVSLSRAQAELYENRLDLERERNKLLVAQMQPHFIFNALATIQSLCYTDSEAAADCINVFGDYLRANMDSISSDDLISFSSELEHIGQYVKLEKASTDVSINVIYELEVQDFLVPPLTMQPIVENAIKHGVLTRRDGTGFVKIRTEETEDRIRITVTDNGTGASMTPRQKEHQSVGIRNVRQRLEIRCGGTLDVNVTEHGSVSVITLPKRSKNGGEKDVYDRSR